MALIQKTGSKYWYYQCKINGRKWIRSTGCTRRDKAEAAIPKLRKLAALHREQPNDCLQLKKAIVAEVNRVELDVSSSEAERVSYALGNFFSFAGDVQLEKVNEALLREFMRYRMKKAARSTINRELCYVVRMMRENGFAVIKPDVKRGKRVKHRPFSEEELKVFFAHCEEAHRMLFLTMLMTGARPAELMPSRRSSHVALLKEDIDPEIGTIHLRTAKLKPGQDEKVRNIRVPEKFMDDLVQYARSIPGSFVFLENQSLHNLFDRILKRASIPKVNALGHKLTSHSFRHTYATRMAEQVGSNPFILKELMGHSKITTTEIYCHPQAPTLMMQMPDLSISEESEPTGVVEEGWWKKEKTAQQGAA